MLVGVLALAGCGGGEDGGTTTTETSMQTSTQTTTETSAETTTQPEVEQPTEVRIAVVDGQPQGGIVRESVDKDERVVILVKSDVADEIHLHGYDLSREVAVGGTARLPFVADLPGRFEVELEGSGVQIAELTVEP